MSEYVKSLFEIVQNSFSLRRELYLTKNAKDRIILDIDSFDSFSNCGENTDRCGAKDLDIIELKISLDENDNEFYSLVQKIQEIAKEISSNSDNEANNYAKARSMISRIKQRQYDNL